MIKLVKNALTEKKNTVNFMDQNGMVVGFNPQPDGNPISFYVYTESGELLDTKGKFVEEFLSDAPYHFGKDGHIVKHHNIAKTDDKLEISLLSDGDEPPLVLQLVCLNSLYYTASFVLSDEDRMFFKAPTPVDPKTAEILAEIRRVMDELTAIRARVSQARMDLAALQKKLH